MGKMRLVTSNLNKLKEFRRLSDGLDVTIQHGADIKEVKTDNPLEVAIYKAIEAGDGSIVEDTVLKIDGEEITDIRYRLSELRGLVDYEGCKLEWITTLAVNNGDSISLYSGITYGTFKNLREVPDDSFGFDPFFIPKGSSNTLYELEKEGRKDDFSARKVAIKNLTLGIKEGDIEINSVPRWKGEYQI